MTRTVVIAGAGGFLAGHTAPAFRQRGWRVIGIGRNELGERSALYDAFQRGTLSEVAGIANVLEKYGPELVIHFAAPSSVPASIRYPVADFEAHALPTLHLLDAIRTSMPATRLLLISSAAVYGEPQALPVGEDAPLRPLSPYGFHKLHQELLCDEYRVVHGVASLKARIFSTFGEGLRRLAVWDLTRQALRGELTGMGTGEETRDYLYAGDIGEALATIAENALFDGSAINVASGVGTTIRDLAAAIARLAGAGEPRFSGIGGAGMPSRWLADVGKLHALGVAPRTPFDAALARTVDWIREHA